MEGWKLQSQPNKGMAGERKMSTDYTDWHGLRMATWIESVDGCGWVVERNCPQIIRIDTD